MRLSRARVTKYRSVRDTDWFEIEEKKTIFVGPNEAGKSAILEALQQLNPPKGVRQLDALRDYPRSEYNDISTRAVDPSDITIVTGEFALDPQDIKEIPREYANAIYVYERRLDNSARHHLRGGPQVPTYGSIRIDLNNLATYASSHPTTIAKATPPAMSPSGQLASITSGLIETSPIRGIVAAKLITWLESIQSLINNAEAREALDCGALIADVGIAERYDNATTVLSARMPVFVLFSNYFRVRPLIHLAQLASRLAAGTLDDGSYDYGNKCLLQLLGFSAQELSELGRATEPAPGNTLALSKYRDQLDKRRYQLNAASVRLTKSIRDVWVPVQGSSEAERLRVVADAQYLKVVVEDELGVEIELDQRSEGFQWLVSFFVVFFAEADGKHKNSILLLDEPGLSLHGLKQREFRTTLSRLAEENQTIYTTHSPFLVGPDELDFVRVVEMPNRDEGTKVHTVLTSADSGALLPLQEALGYDLAQSLFAQQRNLVLEGITDYWYVEAVSQLLDEGGLVHLDKRISCVPANSAGKVVYFATILHAQKLKVAALLDSDNEGDNAAKQDTLVHTLGNKRIIRTKDAYSGSVGHPEIEDMLRTTLIAVAKSELGWDVSGIAHTQPNRPIVDLFTEHAEKFSKYRLAKAFLKWAREHDSASLTSTERTQWEKLFELANVALK